MAGGLTIREQPAEIGEVTIGNDVWIGAGAKILANVHIGDGAVIGSNAVVTSDIPANAIAVGVPAKVIRYREIAVGDQHPAPVLDAATWGKI